MKKTLSTVIVAVLAAILPHVAAAQSESGDAKVVIVDGLQIAKAAALDFGSIKANGGGECIMGLDGTRTVTSGDILLLGYSTGAAGTFAVSGTSGATYTITLPTTDVTLENSAKDASMTVNTFTAESKSTSSATDGKIDSEGKDMITVGAKLTVLPSQKADTYTGTYTVTVAYN